MPAPPDPLDDPPVIGLDLPDESDIDELEELERRWLSRYGIKDVHSACGFGQKRYEEPSWKYLEES